MKGDEVMKLAKHREAKEKSVAPVSRVLAPFWPQRRWSGELEHFWEDPFAGWLSPGESFYEAWTPAVNVYEEKDNVIVKVELPGMKKEELEVYLTGDQLNIAGERKFENEEKTAKLYRSESYFGRFHRSVRLPSPVKAEKIAAHYKDGILSITCPKTEEAKRKEIEIKVE
jgi:HSP20 family protein